MNKANHCKNLGPLAEEGPLAGFEHRVGVGCERTAIEVSAQRLGRDWVLRISGGDAHVGAVATAWAEKQELTVIPPHKEGPLAQKCARRWAELTGQVCVALAGIHQDRATGEEIRMIVENVDQAMDILEQRWQEAEHERKS